MRRLSLILLLLLSCCRTGYVFSFSPALLDDGFTHTTKRSLSMVALQMAAHQKEGQPPADELTSALARLDQQWAIQQRNKPTSRWTKLILDPQPNNNNNDDDSTTSIPNILSEEFVYILEPPGKSLPSCLIVFCGGAGLGQFPHIAYNEFLTRTSDRLNAAVIAAPYSVGLDHFGLAKSVGDRSRRAMMQCEEEDDGNGDRQQQQQPLIINSSLPTYCIAHSLGCKLSAIYMAATGKEYDGIGFMCFNNFGFSKTIGMAKTFAERIRQSTGLGANLQSEVVDQVFSFAENIVGSIGIEFTPNPSETERLLSVKYDENRQQKTRLFVFDDDDLDSTQDFVQACQGGDGLEISALPGSHLSPVYFKLGLDDLPEEVKDMAQEASGGFSSVAFGNEEELDELVQEVSGWVLGKAPARKPFWQRERPKIAGSTEND